MKMIEDKRQVVRRNIKKLNEELEKLTGTAPSSNERLEGSHLSTIFNEYNLETTRNKTTEVTAAPLSRIPRFMKPTVCSRRKSGTDHQTSEEKVKFPARRRRPLSRRAESVSFPVKGTSENNSERSISRNSCLVDLNVQSNADETEYSQDATECDIKSLIFQEQETSSKSSVQQKDCIVNSDRFGKRKKNSFISTNIAKVDNWLRLHKNQPTVSSISQKSKRVLAIPVPQKKQSSKGKEEDDWQHREKQCEFTKKKLTNSEKMGKCVDVAKSGRSKLEEQINKPPINLDNFINRDSRGDSICPRDTLNGETILHTRSLVNLFMEENKCSSFSPPKILDSSFYLNHDGNEMNKILVMQEEKGKEQSLDTLSPENNEWCKLSPSKLTHCKFETTEYSGSSMSVSEQELQCLQMLTEVSASEQELQCSQVPSEIGTDKSESEDVDTVDQILENSSIEIWSRPGIHNMRTQRALFLDNENPKELIMAAVKSQENTENSGKSNNL